TWEATRAGMFVEAEFEYPLPLTSVTMASHTAVFGVPFEFYGRTTAGNWVLLDGSPSTVRRPPEDLRPAARRAVQRAGYSFIVTPTGSEGNGPLGDRIVGHEAEWAVELAGRASSVMLYRIR